jgi:hypothetical protein
MTVQRSRIKNPITPSSVYSRKRRLPQLRKLFFRLSSMKRGKFAKRIFSKTVGTSIVVVKLIDESVLFLECNFNEIDDQEISKACKKLTKALHLMKKDIMLAFNKRAIRKSVVKCLGVAITRYCHIVNKCDELWRQLGCISIALLD